MDNKQAVAGKPAFEASSEILKVIAHPMRLRIIDMLATPGVGNKCVTEIYQALDIPQAIASQHLIQLKDRGVLKSHKQGTKIFYSVINPKLWSVVRAIEAVVA